MHVLRSFDINKPGLPIGEVKGGVIGGSLIQGDFETGDEIEIRPGLYDEKKGKYDPIMSKISSPCWSRNCTSCKAWGLGSTRNNFGSIHS